MSIESCRRLVGPSVQISDGELLALRDQLYTIAEFSVSLLPPSSERESIEERAAILEFEAGLPKRDAEFGALVRHLKPRR